MNKNSNGNFYGSSNTPSLLNLDKYLNNTNFNNNKECNKKNKKSKHRSTPSQSNNGLPLLINVNSSEPISIPNHFHACSTPNNSVEYSTPPLLYTRPQSELISNDNNENNQNNDNVDHNIENNVENNVDHNVENNVNNNVDHNVDQNTENNNCENNNNSANIKDELIQDNTDMQNSNDSNGDNNSGEKTVEYNKLFDLMELLTNLKLLSHVKQNEKLSCDNNNNFVEIDNRYYLQGIRRWMNGDSREETIKFIDKLINSSESISEKLIMGTIDNTNEDDAHNLKLLTEDLISCKNGLNNLKLTYNDDKLFISKMDNYIEMIKMRIDKNNKHN
jgi:hypothetical protein